MSNATGDVLIRFTCQKCNASLTAQPSQSDTEIVCSGCQTPVRVPASMAAVPPAEQSAPAVVSQYEAITLPRATSAPVPDTTSPDASAAVDFAAVQSSTVASASVGSTEAADPFSRPPSGDAHRAAQAEFDSPRARIDERYRQNMQAPQSRRGMVAISAVILLAILSAAGVSISNGLERARIQDAVSGLLVKAQASYAGNDIDGAAGLASDAQRTIDTSPQELDAELKGKWLGRIRLYNSMKEEAGKLQAVLAEASKDIKGARGRLESKKLLLGAATDDNRPMLARIESLLAEVDALELKQKVETIRAQAEQADNFYKEGKLEEAGLKSEQVSKDMAANPKVEHAEIENRLQVLRKRAEQLKSAKDARLAARQNFAEARTKLQRQIDGIDATKDDLKPLAKRLADLRKEIVEEEKRSVKLSGAEARELKEVATALSRFDPNAVTETVEGDTIGVRYDGKPLRLGFQRSALSRSLFIEAGGNRFSVDLELFAGGPKKSPRPGRIVRHALALAEAMSKAGVKSEELWNASEEAPLVSARRTGADQREYIFLGDRLYVGKPQQKTASEMEVEADFAKKAEALAVAVENDEQSPEEARRVVASGVRATFKDADWYDHLRGEFVRKVVDEGYIEANLPGATARLKKELQAFHEAYGKISKPFLSFSGATEGGDEAVEFRTFEEHAVWQLYDKGADTTTFAIKNPDEEKGGLFILYDFPGKLKEFPAGASPKRVRMTHQAVGVTATYDPASGKMTFDPNAWNLATALEMPPLSPKYVAEKGFGTPAWALPPHVLLVNMAGDTRSIVPPHGKLDVQDFSKIAEPAKRTQAMESFMDQMAKVLPSAGYLHLYFRYFHEYILDSPVTSCSNLLGSRAHCGDMHQTAYQSLERLMGGRYVGDCDDLAEFFMNVTRRQNKLSYVMALPQHAACGWVEKAPGDAEYTFYVLDTGPPRMFLHKDLDKAIEMACRAYDDDKTMRFDPKSLGFLFRFNGEPTRAPYFLSSRMYTDKQYGEVMEKVQGYWHFHFYALGIQHMTEMIQKGDRVPENCIELAGLYGQVREVADSIKWTDEALNQLGPDDRLSRYSEEFRKGMLWREEHDNAKAYETVKKMIAELKALESDPQRFHYTSMRLQLMGLLEAIDRPFEAWNLVSRDIFHFAQRGALRIEHVGGLTTIYSKMKEMQREGKEIGAREKSELKQLEEILNWFYANSLFEPDDDFNSWMRKYAFLGVMYAGKYGQARLTQELLKPGPFPDPAKPRDHKNRKDPEEEDWKWIRLSLPSYSIAIGDALDLDEPPEKWRKDEAVKLTDAMLQAATVARKFGSLASSEFQLLTSRVFRAFLVKDYADLEKVLAEVKERDWARLTSDIAETFGRSARFLTPAEFAAQYRVFAKYIKPRTAYFTVIYEAYRAEAIEQAIAASKVALECWPGDEDMAREAKYLAELAKKKLAAKAQQDAEKKKGVPDKVLPVPEQPVK